MSEPTEAIELDPETALRAMLESEGWALFMAQARSEYGNAAIVTQLRHALETTAPANHSVASQTVLAIADAVKKLLAWPEEEAERLKSRPKKEPADRFAHLRRVNG